MKKTIKTLEKKFKKADLKKVVKNSKELAKSSNDWALNTAEGAVSETLVVAEQWQKVAQKAINGGFKLADNQQELVFQALTAVKGQYTHGKKRVKTLFA